MGTFYSVDGSGDITAAGSITATSETLTATTNQLVLGTTNTTTIDSVAPSASRTYTIPDVGINANVALSVPNFSLTSISADISSPAAIFTPVTSGMYHVCLYWVATAGSSSDTVPQGFTQWTDITGGQQVYTYGPSSGNATLYSLSSYDLYCVAGQSIKFYTSGGTYATAVYNFYFSVVQL